MALPRRDGMKLITQFAQVLTRDFDTELSLSATATIPVVEGEFFQQNTAAGKEQKLIRTVDSTKPSWASWQERGRYDVQAIAPRGRITVIFMGPYEAEFKMVDTDDTMTLNLPLRADTVTAANLDTQARGLLTNALKVQADHPMANGDLIIGYVTRALSGGVVRVYCTNSFAPSAGN